MIFTKATATVKSLCHPKGNKYKKIRLDCVWQRSFVWDSERSSMFIHTLMTNGYVFPILVAEDESDPNALFILDGLQRQVTCRRFISGEMKLDVNTPPVNGVEVAKKTFKQLPTELQDAILDYAFDLVYVKGANEADLGELFHRLNMSAPITKTTLLRAEAGVEIAKYLNQFEVMDFFNKRVLVSPTARKTHGVTEVVLQTLSLFLMSNNGFSSKDLKKFALGMKENPVSEENTTAFIETIQYLEEAFPEVEGEEDFEYDNLKKSAVPLLVKAASICLENEISAVDFFDWTESFFSGKNRLGNSFKSNSSAGTSAKKNIRKRMGIMIESLKETFEGLEVPASADFAIWDEQEAQAKIEAERVKAEKKIAAQLKREATKAAKAAKEAAKAAKAGEAAPVVETVVDEVDEVVEFAESLDEEDSEEGSLLDAIRAASNPVTLTKTSAEWASEVAAEIFG